MFVTFLSDYGLEDDFVGTCHGVMKRIAPEVQIIDITHGIPPQDVLQGALVLAHTIPYMPAGVHLAVVDPTVGSARRALALRDRGGRLYVGPDNGLLLLAAERDGRVEAAHELVNAAYALEPVSRTFHGRDVFAPAAAHLTRGVALEELGPALDPELLVRLDVPEPDVAADAVRAHVLYVDRFGNLELNVGNDDLARAGILAGGAARVRAGGRRFAALVASTFADVRPGQLVLYEDSYRKYATAVNGGSAAEMLAAGAGAEVEIHRASA